MRHRQLPPELRLSVRKYDQYKWLATRGVDEESLLKGLPLDLCRDIKRHLCLDLVRRAAWRRCKKRREAAKLKAKENEMATPNVQPPPISGLATYAARLAASARSILHLIPWLEVHYRSQQNLIFL